MEIKIIMMLPEVKDELLKRANPNQFDLYQCAFNEGGELETYALYIHKKLLLLYENQQMEAKRVEMTLANIMKANNYLVTSR